ncbi:hypothetical protein B0H65DRAFT_504045 [Neurospora tetraspora]|uniref:Uncharacterized protein n=1 Tax=Neurospora tetraspora TaxID=94610 RepID=A0AAE0IZV4_9PEZI|nr:hypothetical protein B0H65DRAFT_504045 [Neurospora tetraspora]
MPPRTPNLNIKPIIKMPDQKLPVTPRPKNGGNTRITDYFTSIERTDNGKKSKRELEDEEDDQPTKRLKRSDDGHAGSIQTARYQIKVDTPKTRKPASARLLDDTDGGLRESLVGRWDFLEEETVEDEEQDPIPSNDPSPVPIRTPTHANNPRCRKPASSRLLDDVDGGLSDSLGGRFETPRYQEAVSGGEEETGVEDLTHDTVDDDTEAEIIRMDDSEDDMSSAENCDNEDSEDENKENVPPRVRYRTPSPQRLPPVPEQHHDQNNETRNSTPNGPPSASPFSFLLPSPVVDLPAP